MSTFWSKRRHASARPVASARKRCARFDAHVGGEVDVVDEWRVAEPVAPDIDDALIEHVRACDLVIVAQPDAGKNTTGRIDALGDLILRAGRPVFVVPYAWNAQAIERRVFVASNGSRESTRAIFDALSFLYEADEVRLYVIEEAAGTRTLPGAEIAATLVRHGVRVIAEAAAKTGPSIAETILSRMSDHGSDLLVMGGYGHSRAREFIFGGATRNILKTMTAPVLFSH